MGKGKKAENMKPKEEPERPRPTAENRWEAQKEREIEDAIARSLSDLKMEPPSQASTSQSGACRVKEEPLEDGSYGVAPPIVPAEEDPNTRNVRIKVEPPDSPDAQYGNAPNVKQEPLEEDHEVAGSSQAAMKPEPVDEEPQRPRLVIRITEPIVIEESDDDVQEVPAIVIDDSARPGARLRLRVKQEVLDQPPLFVPIKNEPPDDYELPGTSSGVTKEPDNLPAAHGRPLIKMELPDPEDVPKEVREKVQKIRSAQEELKRAHPNAPVVKMRRRVAPGITLLQEPAHYQQQRSMQNELGRLVKMLTREEISMIGAAERPVRSCTMRAKNAMGLRRAHPPAVVDLDVIPVSPSPEPAPKKRGRPRKIKLEPESDGEYIPPGSSSRRKPRRSAAKSRPRQNGVQGKSDEMSAVSTTKRSGGGGRNTNNSRSSIPTPLHDPSVTTIRRSYLLDSDDDDDDDEEEEKEKEMASTSSVTDPTKRPRTPKPRYSPETQRRNVPRAAMSALSIETHRNNDLNADGTGPSSSGSTQPPVSGGSERRESRRRDDSSRRRTVTVDETPKSHKKTHSSIRPKKKPSSPSPPPSQDETFLDDSDECPEWDNLPIVVDDPSYKLSTDQKSQFRDIKRQVRSRLELKPSELAEIYRHVRSEDVRLPRKIHFGSYIMNSWFGAPFPAEYIRLDKLFICEYCLYYARSDPVMQNHANKCYIRAPPGVEIYRKGNVSVFEVDGRIEREYCQNVCLVSRLFLESKTLFYDTDPFFFYIVTQNDHVGCHFAGYFSKEKYDPDKNNLSCIMTLPCYQEKGYGRFLIDISYALSRREGWFGGPERPLSDLGRIAYGSYWRGSIYQFLNEHKRDLEGGKGVSIDCVARKTGINHHDILEFLDSMGWIRGVNPDANLVHDIKWNVDWGLLKMYMDERKRMVREEFDERYLDWEPRKITPKMDSFVELTQKELEEDEEKMRNRQLQSTPISSASLLKSTPASTTSQQNSSSMKKTLSSRTQRTTARNLKLELTKKVTVPAWADAREVTDDEADQKPPVRERKKRERKDRSSARCRDSTLEIKREESPGDDAGPSFAKPAPGRRSRARAAIDDSSDAGTSTSRKPSASSGKGKYRNKNSGKNMFEDSEDEPSESSPDSSDDDVPFGAQKGKKGRQPQKGKKGQKKPKTLSGKKFPPNYGKRDSEAEEKRRSDDDDDEGKGPRPAPGGEGIAMEVDEVKTWGEDRKTDEEMDEELMNHNDIEPEIDRHFEIRTPESYHSTPPASPVPMLVDNLPPPQLFGNHHAHHSSHFDDNDAAPPLLVSEVSNLSVSDRNEPEAACNGSASLAPNLADEDGYTTEDDEAPPRLSPQYEKNETTHEEEVEKGEKEAPMLMAPVSHNEMHEYQDPMAPGPSSMHMTPQMMSQSQSQNPSTSQSQSMMASTPQNPYSHQGPNSHQQTTPGSGGVPSCGPVYSHSTPEQQAQQQQQFMSPMAGMPASVSSVHSVHNSNSMEMVGGPSSLQQHTPQQQQQQYDMGLGMGQMPQDNGVVMGNGVTAIEQQNQIMMAQHGFNSPPGQNNAIPPPQQPPQPPQVAQMPPAPAPATGRRRSESAAQRKSRQQQQQQQARANQQMPAHMMAAMQPQMMMNGFYNYNMHGYPGYPAMWAPYAPYNAYYPPNMMPEYAAASAWPGYPQPAQQPAPPNGNGHMPDVGAGAGLNQFPPPANQWFQYQNQNDMR